MSLYYHLGKEDIILLKKNNGFSIIEMLFAMSIVMMLVATVLPIYKIIQVEQHILRNRLSIQTTLHDLLTEKLINMTVLDEQTLSLENHAVNIQFSIENGITEGCAQWVNEKSQTENVCLYGMEEQ